MNNPKRKYPHTKALVKIAHEVGGLNYKDIATRARLSPNSKSQVSKWARGAALANYGQMQNLIEEFGHHLKKQYEHIYYQHIPMLTQRKIDILKCYKFEATVEVDGQYKPLQDLSESELKPVTGCEIDKLNLRAPQ